MIRESNLIRAHVREWLACDRNRRPSARKLAESLEVTFHHVRKIIAELELEMKVEEEKAVTREGKVHRGGMDEDLMEEVEELLKNPTEMRLRIIAKLYDEVMRNSNYAVAQILVKTLGYVDEKGKTPDKVAAGALSKMMLEAKDELAKDNVEKEEIK